MHHPLDGHRDDQEILNELVPHGQAISVLRNPGMSWTEAVAKEVQAAAVAASFVGKPGLFAVRRTQIPDPRPLGEQHLHTSWQKFYAVLNRMGNGEKGAMSETWSHGLTVTAMHPVGGRATGWEAVRDSFDQVAGMAAEARIGLKDQFIQVHGDLAYELGVEHGEFKMAGHHVSLEHRVTNIYRREGGGWKLVHHHTDTSSAMLDVLNRLRPPLRRLGACLACCNERLRHWRKRWITRPRCDACTT